MTFEYEHYITFLLKSPLAAVLFTSLCILVFGFKPKLIFPKTSGLVSNIIFRFLIVLMCLYGLYIESFSLKHGIYLVNEKEYMSVEYIGSIEEIEESEQVKGYIDGEGIVICKIVTIDGEEYVFMATGDLEVGDIVNVEYLPKSRVVLKWTREET